MRAAEASVRSAPKPMKIFPISELCSQTELSLLLEAITGNGRGCGSAIPTVFGADGASCGPVRSASLSWSEAGAGLSGNGAAAVDVAFRRQPAESL